MAGPSLAETRRQVVAFFHGEHGLPDPRLPFDERWEQAEHLPPHDQQLFVAREIRSLIRGREDYDLGFVLDPHEIESSTLPQLIKDHIADLTGLDPDFKAPRNPILYFERRHDQKRFFLGILRSSWFGSKSTEVGVCDNDYSVYGGIALRLSPNSKQIRESLSPFSVSKELVRFGGDVIATRRQSSIQPQQ